MNTSFSSFPGLFHVALLLLISFSFSFSSSPHICSPSSSSAFSPSLSPLSLSSSSSSSTTTTLVNAFNVSVSLRGVNLGGWLVFEEWMCGIIVEPSTGGGGGSGRQPLKKIQQRFGEAAAREMQKVWQDNFITKKDLDYLQQMQINMVRVPFAYYNFLDDSGNWISSVTGLPVSQPDFSRLDWIVREAGARGIYVILCFHVWQGQDGIFNSTLTSSNSNPYSDISNDPSNLLSLIEQQAASKLLTAIAAHFKGNGNVAAIDVINEPSGSYSPYYGYIHDVLYKAVRSGDPLRLVVLCWVTPSPSRHWTGVLYEAHDYSSYQTGNSTLDMLNFNAFYNEAGGLFQVAKQVNATGPFFIGEFQGASPVLPWILNQYNQLNFHWSMWTYKGVNIGGWALVNYDSSFPKINVSSVSLSFLNSTWQSLSNFPGMYYESSITNTLITAAAQGRTTPWNVSLDQNCQSSISPSPSPSPLPSSSSSPLPSSSPSPSSYPTSSLSPTTHALMPNAATVTAATSFQHVGMRLLFVCFWACACVASVGLI